MYRIERLHEWFPKQEGPAAAAVEDLKRPMDSNIADLDHACPHCFRPHDFSICHAQSSCGCLTSTQAVSHSGKYSAAHSCNHCTVVERPPHTVERPELTPNAGSVMRAIFPFFFISYLIISYLIYYGGYLFTLLLST